MWKAVAAAAGCLLAMAGAASGAGDPPITPEADRVMWCASAFFWLAGSADDAGDAAEAELYDGWASELTERGAALLAASGIDAESAGEIIDRYDQMVLDEIDAGEPRYDAATCPELVAE